MVSGLCHRKSRGSLTSPGPPEAHPQNIGVFCKTITNPFILSQQQKYPYFSRMVGVVSLDVVVRIAVVVVVAIVLKKRPFSTETR